MSRRLRISITAEGAPWKQSLTSCASGSATRSLRRDSGRPWPAFPPSTRRRSTTPSSLPPRGEKTLRGMVLNMELGRFPTETAAFLRECPQARDMDILFNNELRSSRQTVAPQCFRAFGGLKSPKTESRSCLLHGGFRYSGSHSGSGFRGAGPAKIASQLRI